MEFNQRDFENGTKKVKEYIAFCWANYTYSMNIELLTRSEFLTDIMNFVQGQKSYIPNLYGKTFEQFCKGESSG